MLKKGDSIQVTTRNTNSTRTVTRVESSEHDPGTQMRPMTKEEFEKLERGTPLYHLFGAPADVTICHVEAVNRPGMMISVKDLLPNSIGIREIYSLTFHHFHLTPESAVVELKTALADEIKIREKNIEKQKQAMDALKERLSAL